jgi:polar amino acid transport system substrate-binding protein
MASRRRFILQTFCVATCVLAGCATVGTTPDPQTLAALVPTNTLRVGVYRGSPSSLVQDAKTGTRAGVAYDLGHALAKQLGVPVQVVEFARVAQVITALKSGELDFTVTNATESRARDVDFTPALIQLELGYLVAANSALTSAQDVDQVGMRVGVSQGSTSQGVLTRQFKHATAVPAASLLEATEMLRQHRIDAFATNKGILFEMSDALEGSRVLNGRWGTESMAIAIPKGREAGQVFLQQFAREVTSTGQLQSMIQRAGLRGTLPQQ